MSPRLFLLSPANASGRRGRLLRTSVNVDVALRLRSPNGAPIGEVYRFISGLYFRGKLTYAERFAPGSTYVITPCQGLLSPETSITMDVFEQLAGVPIDPADPRYLEPLVRDLVPIAAEWPGDVVLLGSVASSKYTKPLLDVLGDRLLFPSTFVGRGDMSRGGVLLRAAEAGEELAYVPVAGAVLKGTRPPRLPRK
ncbi:MAG TPA: hypothetical protein VMF13_07345 [Luteitalea sp.]|nr:hypothetical protein [Luteitalea sp.]